MFVRKSSKDSTPLLHRLVVEKHGSHNQSSHGKKGGGGDGGGGSGSPSPIASSEASDKARTTTAKVLVDDMSAAEDAIDGVADRMSSNRDNVTLDRAMNHFTGAKKDFSDAQKLKGTAQTAKIQTGVGKVFAGTDQLSIIDYKRTDDILAGILDDVQATFGDADSAFRDLGVDVDDLFGP
jgi:hypothetical protein